MKTKSIIYCFILAVGFLGSQTAMADDAFTSQALTLTVDGSALLKVTGPTTVAMSLTGATEAGAAVSPISTDTLSRLKISSLSGGGNTGRSITAVASGVGLASTRTSLSIQLLPPVTANLTNFVNYASEGGALQVMQVVANTDGPAAAITLVTGIKTCWSGTAADDGYQIKYKYMSTGGGTPLATTVTITYTIGQDV